MATKKHPEPDTLLDTFKPTPDNWYPCYEDNQVHVRAFWRPDMKWGRVCAWGADDFGLEKDFKDLGELRKEVRWVKAQAQITHAALRGRGWGGA